MKASLDFPCPMIKNQKELEAFLEEASHSKRLALDTEFLSHRTYRPRLCLLQLALDNGRACLIDPLDPAINLAPVYRLINNDSIVKVLHAGQQDIAILYYLSGTILSPVFDTQIGAMMCGMGQSLSLSDLLQKLTGQRLDKGNQLSDWSRRPLSDKQTQYALGDVLHLHRIHDLLSQRLMQSNRLAWAERECQDVLGQKRAYDPNPEQAWRKLKLSPAIIGKFSPQQWRLVQEIAAWRERQALERNMPRSHVLADDVLTTIGIKNPETIEALRSLLSSGKRYSLRIESLHSAILEGARQPPLPPPSFRPIEPNQKALIFMLDALLYSKSHQHHISRSLIATRRDLESLSRGDTDSPALQGWRREIFGSDALLLCAGALSLSVRDGLVQTRVQTNVQTRVPSSTTT